MLLIRNFVDLRSDVLVSGVNPEDGAVFEFFLPFDHKPAMDLEHVLEKDNSRP